MKKLVVLMCVVVLLTGVAMAQLGSGNPTYSQGAQGLQGMDKLGAHQNNGRGCQGCHIPHSGSRGNGGNAGSGAGSDPNTGTFALWGEDLGPLYGKTLAFGDEGSFPISLPAGFSTTDEAVITGVVMCLSCHDGNFAKGAMIQDVVYEKAMFPAGFYGPNAIPTLLGNDLTNKAEAYYNDHPVGPAATLDAVGVASRLKLFPAGTLCQSHGTDVDCLQPDTTKPDFMAFYANYGAFNITQTVSGNATYTSGGRTTGVVIPAGATDAKTAYLVCTTCHTPHSMYSFSGTAGGVKGTYPTFFFVTAPYNPFATPAGNQASSATQFCRQCHFTGAGGSNEGGSSPAYNVNISGVTTKF